MPGIPMEVARSFTLKNHHNNYKNPMIYKEYPMIYQWLVRRILLRLIHQNIFSRFHNITKHRKLLQIILLSLLKSGTNDLIYISVLVDKIFLKNKSKNILIQKLIHIGFFSLFLTRFSWLSLILI